MRKIILYISFIILAAGVTAFETGGEAEVETALYLDNDNTFDYKVTESALIEIFLPDPGKHEMRCEFEIFKPLQGMSPYQTTEIFFRKLYMRFDFKYFKLTLGRQPVSWSFGSMLNTVDYTLGSVALDEEYNSKYTDAAEIYIPINWNSGLGIISSFPGGICNDIDCVKWGGRLRAGIADYDITINYVNEADTALNTSIIPTDIIPDQRAGITFKGDIGNIGVYGSAGYYFDNPSSGFMSYTVGMDCSFYINYSTQVIVQAEYMGIETKQFSAYITESILRMDSTDQRIDMLISTVTYPFDEFSSITVTGILDADDYSLMLSPIYQILLPYNLDLRISVFTFLGRENTLFSSENLNTKISSLISLKYSW